MTSVLVSTWSDGVFVLAGETRGHELAGCSVRGLVSDAKGHALAIVDGHTLQRRERGAWTVLATTDADLACCVSMGAAIYVGTDDARVLRFEPTGTLTPLHGLDTVAGRDTWYAGQAVIDGRTVGPPLGIRSLTATADGVLLANVHVGGIPRSTDGGVSWHPTIDVESDVHEVRAHPQRPEIVVAAAAEGLCTSRDGGATWTIERAGLHAAHCTAVALAGDLVLLAASAEQFSDKGAVYKRPLDGQGPLTLVGAGVPAWIDGIVDTGCIATHGAAIALVDRGGAVYLSLDAGARFARVASDLREPSGVLIG